MYIYTANVSESGNKLPAPILSLFPTDPKFNPLKFTSDELNEFNDQHVLMKQVRSSMAANNNRERYHVHQELLRTIIVVSVCLMVVTCIQVELMRIWAVQRPDLNRLQKTITLPTRKRV